MPLILAAGESADCDRLRNVRSCAPPPRHERARVLVSEVGRIAATTGGGSRQACSYEPRSTQPRFNGQSRARARRSASR